jgi:hypothetical protein
MRDPQRSRHPRRDGGVLRPNRRSEQRGSRSRNPAEAEQTKDHRRTPNTDAHFLFFGGRFDVEEHLLSSRTMVFGVRTTCGYGVGDAKSPARGALAGVAVAALPRKWGTSPPIRSKPPRPSVWLSLSPCCAERPRKNNE